MLLVNGMSRKVARAAGALLALAGAACGGDDDPSDPANLGPCADNVAVRASSGTSPVFTWSPACTVRALGVEFVGGTDVWWITATGDDGIASGVRYGRVPRGATQDVPAPALSRGERYQVGLLRGPGGSEVVAGAQKFTP